MYDFDAQKGCVAFHDVVRLKMHMINRLKELNQISQSELYLIANRKMGIIRVHSKLSKSKIIEIILEHTFL